MIPLEVSRSRIAPWLIGTSLLATVAPLIFVAAGCGSNDRPAEAEAIRKLEPQPISELYRYAGNEACAACHPQQSGVHSASEHARAMSRVDVAGHGELFRRPSDVHDSVRDIRYRTAVEGDRCVLIASSAAGSTVAEAEYGFGSGKHGITYLGKQRELGLELRLSYYPHPKRWGFSPGQQLNGRSGGMVLETGLMKPAETVQGCFVCHSTVVGKENDRLLPETTMMGVGCEACHGPAQDHVAAMQKGEKKLHLPRLGKMDPQRVSQELCGQCHRSPAGEDLGDPFNRSQLPRLQGLAMAQSRCFTNSAGKLSCLTCHDSHDQKPQPRSFYNLKCLNCHTGSKPPEPPCPIEPKGDCVSCHMPAQPVGMPFDLRYRTHWIKVWSGR